LYSPPEVRELGTVSAFTLGSTTPGTITFNKKNNTVADTFTGFLTSQKGKPCTIVGGPSNGLPCTP
jgi:hypothetical protein